MSFSNGKLRLPCDWLLGCGLACTVPLLFDFVLPRILPGFYGVYVAQPAVWLLIILYFLHLPRYRGVGKKRMLPLLIRLAGGVALFQIYLMVVAGFLSGFGKSPYSFTLRGILFNLVYVASGLLGMELCRAWLLNRLLHRPAAFLPVLLALLFAVIDIPAKQIPGPESTLETWTQFCGSSVHPIVMEHLLASFLAMWGGALPALVYRGLLEAFEWFCPVLPDLNWAMKALTGTVVPLVGLAIIQEYYASQLASRRRKRTTGEGMVRTTVFGVAAVVTIWFSLGVFPVRPAVIYSGSMRPTLEVGDIVIIARKNPDLLTVGDIIAYRVEGSPIPTIHRVIEVEGAGFDRKFITKGDDNDQPDEPVQQGQVKGKVVLVIPRLGWASIAARKLFI
ncbi:MAG: signal peptidase [Thermacetogenium sp.]|nr:signal peptidase [Thermacetogenium sp.]